MFWTECKRWIKSLQLSTGLIQFHLLESWESKNREKWGRKRRYLSYKKNHDPLNCGAIWTKNDIDYGKKIELGPRDQLVWMPLGLSLEIYASLNLRTQSSIIDLLRIRDFTKVWIFLPSFNFRVTIVHYNGLKSCLCVLNIQAESNIIFKSGLTLKIYHSYAEISQLIHCKPSKITNFQPRSFCSTTH
jgi:hypothetical protein